MTKKTSALLAIAVTLATGFCHAKRAAEPAAQPAATKDLILPGEVFSLGGKTAFVFAPVPAERRFWNGPVPEGTVDT
ncbi:MAG: hypothetical protein ACKOB1_11290 [Planctomycetia bacterium]